MLYTELFLMWLAFIWLLEHFLIGWAPNPYKVYLPESRGERGQGTLERKEERMEGRERVREREEEEESGDWRRSWEITISWGICPRFAEVPDFALSTLTRMGSVLLTVHIYTLHYPVMDTCLPSLPLAWFSSWRQREPTQVKIVL